MEEFGSTFEHMNILSGNPSLPPPWHFFVHTVYGPHFPLCTKLDLISIMTKFEQVLIAARATFIVQETLGRLLTSVRYNMNKSVDSQVKAGSCEE